MTSRRSKLIDVDGLAVWRETVRTRRQKLVVTNGCFDIIHLGHVTYLNAARNQGDALLVGVNSDASVKQLKGIGRPINPERERAEVLAALESVDAVCIFRERNAAAFLATASPDIWAKGGDYSIDALDPDEAHTVRSSGGQIIILPLVQFRSTTSLLSKISSIVKAVRSSDGTAWSAPP